MSRAAMTAAKLAREVQCDADEVLIRLWDVGISVPNAGCVIPRSKLALARRTLELGRPRSRSERLAARDGRAGRDRATAAPTSTELDVTPDPHKAKIRRPKGKLKTADSGFQWELIGRLEPVRFLSEEELNSIHWAIVHDFKKDRDPIAPPGIRDLTLFGSAVFRPQTSLQGFAKYPSVAMAGAALLHAIVHNHPFHNGNKRTALVVKSSDVV